MSPACTIKMETPTQNTKLKNKERLYTILMNFVLSCIIDIINDNTMRSESFSSATISSELFTKWATTTMKHIENINNNGIFLR